ncbi:MAG: hypothetical protein WAN58_17965 [Anaerolineales bacterium]
MLSTIQRIQRIQWRPYLIDRQIYRRATRTSFDVDPKVDRSLSLASRASARSVVRTAPKKGHREALHCSSFIGRQIALPNRILVKGLRRSYHTITPYTCTHRRCGVIPTAEVGGFTALFR